MQNRPRYRRVTTIYVGSPQMYGEVHISKSAEERIRFVSDDDKAATITLERTQPSATGQRRRMADPKDLGVPSPKPYADSYDLPAGGEVVTESIAQDVVEHTVWHFRVKQNSGHLEGDVIIDP